MVDDSLEEAGGASDTTKAKRAPPTIELEAHEVSGATRPPTEASAEPEAGSEQQPEAAAAVETTSPPIAPAPARISPWVIAPFSGAVAAALVILVGWMLGWPAVQAPPPPPQLDTAVVDALGKRVATLEGRLGKVDQAMAALSPGALEKPVASLRNDVASLRTETDKLAAAVNELKSAPPPEPAAAVGATVDLSAINDRIDKLERAASVQSAAIAQANAKATEAKTADDLPLRRLVAASLLDVAVRHGDPFTEELKAAKALAPDADALKPLDQFADKGVPAPPALCRELLTLVPKLSPTAQDVSTTGTGILDKLHAGAAKLVRVERTDATGNDRSAIVARVTAAALRNDLAEASRELSTLSPEERAPAQPWLDKGLARDAALSASHKFADAAMATLASRP